MQTDPNRPKARTERLVIQRVSDETLVYDLQKSCAYCLNPTAAFVWSMCNGDRSVARIADLAGTNFGTKVSKEFVSLAIDQLSEKDLLEHAHPAVPTSQRREWIKQVGMSSLLALPVIASMVAP